MSKLTEVLGTIAGGALVIVIYIVGALISLAVSYFAIKFVLDVGDNIFNKKETEVSQPKESKEGVKSLYVGTCTEEVNKRDASDLNKNRTYCQCIYQNILDAAGTPDNFMHYQSTAGNDKLYELAAPCREAYES